MTNTKKKYLLRYTFIVELLQNKQGATFEEIQKFLELKSEYYDCNLSIDKRTFLRERADIADLFDIHIEFNNISKKYEIVPPDASLNSPFQKFTTKMLATFQTALALTMAKDMQESIGIDANNSLGTEHLLLVLHAIRHKIAIQFYHFKYQDEDTKLRTVRPYALKEFEGRWYLIGADVADANKIKTFGLDRVSELSITHEKFTIPKGFSVSEHFASAYGIVNEQDKPVENVVLAFDYTQAEYIASQPLHHTQKEIEPPTPDDGFRYFSLQLRISYDFEMKLLSMMINPLKIIEPLSLRTSIREKLQRGLEQNPSQ
jgi:predicted DNA-binding transcriptional regulator YafY